MTAKELDTFEKRLSDRKNGARFDKNAEEKSIIDVGEEFGINNVTVIAGGGYVNPSIERVYRIALDNEMDIDYVRREIHAIEKSNKDARRYVQKAFGDWLVESYERQDFGVYEELRRSRRGGEAGEDASGNDERKQLGGGVRGGTGSDAAEDIQYALPNGDLIDQQIDSWLSSRSALEPRNKLADPNGQNQQTIGDGKCQFATKTAQQSQALQARKLFSRMTPTGLKARVAAQSETKTAEYMRTHKPAMEDIRKRAGKAAEKLKGKRGSDELLRLNSSGGYVIDGRSSKWGVPVNEQQQALIDHDKLGKVARPGLFITGRQLSSACWSRRRRAFFILPGYTDFCTRYFPQAPRPHR